MRGPHAPLPGHPGLRRVPHGIIWVRRRTQPVRDPGGTQLVVAKEALFESQLLIFKIATSFSKSSTQHYTVHHLQMLHL